MPRTLSLLTTAFFILAFFYFYQRLQPPPSHTSDSQDEPHYSEFKFDRDGNSHVFDRDRCAAAFPRLYQSLDDAVKARANNPIQLHELEIPQGRCMFRAMVYEGELFVIDLGMPEKCYVPNGRERIVATLSLIHQAVVTAPEHVPNIEFAITYDDLPMRSSAKGVKWALTRQPNDEGIWLMPDYGYWSWSMVGIPSYRDIMRKIDRTNAQTPWTKKTNKAVWRGNARASGIRSKLVEVSERKPWSDIKPSTFTAEGNKDFLTVEQLCKYKFLIQTEGTSYSGRLKYLQLCDSVTISHPLQWQEFHTHLMQAEGPEQNFIQTDSEWSDLDAKMQHHLAHLDEAERIAKRSHELFRKRYLTPAAITCYWRRLFDSWSKVQGFEVQLYNTSSESEAPSLRGIPFAEIAVTFPQKPEEIL